MTVPKATHAGIVCFNRAGQVLICNAKGKLNEWVLPKGHIEAGEESYETAQRECVEETSIEAVTDSSEPLIMTPLDTTHQVVTEWWTGLANRVSPNVTAERASKWVSWPRALKMLTYEEQRQVLKAALAFR